MPIPDTELPKRISWVNVAVITLSPPLAAVAAFFYVREYGVQWGDFAIFAFMYLAAGLGITGGYHRYFSHRAFECGPFMRLAMLIFGAAALENSALSWSSDHRYHHRHTDRDADPYNIGKGFFWAHVGWIFYSPAGERSFENVRDLKGDRLVMWQHRNYLAIAVITGFVVPFLLGLLFDRPMAGLIWGGLVRTVIVHHATFLINSAAHTFGSRPHSEATSARDSWWLPFLSFGEGYHNYHHSHPSDYRNGAAWYHFDPTKWLIGTLSVPGLTWNLRRSR